MGRLSDGKDFILSIVVSMGYCIEVVGEEGQGDQRDAYGGDPSRRLPVQ